METGVNPYISVLMVTYNSSKFIKESINSVLSQDYENFELIICDDKSTDNTWEIIDSFDNPKLVKIQNETNLKEYPNRNKAVSLAEGEYIIFIDGDDLLYPGGLKFLSNYAAKYPDCSMIIARQWDERIIFPKKITPHQFYCFEYLDRGICGINFTKILFKSAILKKEPFIEGLKLGDLYIQYKISLTNSSVIIPDGATWWRRNPGQASEILLRNSSLYLRNAMWIFFKSLEDINCPLSQNEKELAYYNVYGTYLRHIIRQGLKFKFSEVYFLLKQYTVPYKYIPSIFIRQKRGYFYNFNGANPLKD